MRINRYLYALTHPGQRLAGSDHVSASVLESRIHPLALAVDEPESEDGADVWSAWVDLGGEG
jgi:hypothetical protein